MDIAAEGARASASSLPEIMGMARHLAKSDRFVAHGQSILNLVDKGVVRVHRLYER